MAGILYLYRLVIYHVEETEPVVRARFEIMERRLYRYITMPAMGVAILAGAGLIGIAPSYFLKAGWLHAKLTLVVLLIAATIYAGRAMRALAAGRTTRGSRHFRIMNEVPTLLMILIVILAVFRPF